MNKIKVLFKKSKMSISVFMLIIFSFCMVVSHNGFSDMETEKNEAIFEELYQKWEHRVRNDPEFASSAFSTFAENYEEFDAIVELGIPALPLIFEKIEGNRGFFGGALIVAVNKICKISPRDIFIFVDSIPATTKYLEWWKTENKRTFYKEILGLETGNI